MTSPSDGPSKRVANVLAGFGQLNNAERREFELYFRSYVGADENRRAALQKQFNASRVTLGPTGQTCVCCGR